MDFWGTEMKIGKTPGSVGGANTPASTGSGAAQRTGASASSSASTASNNATRSGSSTVTLSPMASQLQSAMALAGSGEVFDAKQVASIKQAISDGNFQVDAEKVADNLIKSVQEMLTARTSNQGA